jgi:hypothetical protein
VADYAVQNGFPDPWLLHSFQRKIDLLERWEKLIISLFQKKTVGVI